MQKGSKYYKIKKPTAPFHINPSFLFFWLPIKCLNF